MQMRFPRHEEQWFAHVEALLMQFGVDIARLQKTSPQTPDPEAGVAFTGPITPTTFTFQGGTDGGSGSPTSGTGPVGTGPSAS
jgi:hypothetical protein